MLACAIGAALAGRALLRSLDDASPSMLAALSAGRDPSVAARPPRRRVVVAVLDGLGRDALESRVAHGDLGRAAWHVRIDVGAPSLSRPVYHVLFTGVMQPVSGIRTNAHRGPARADTLQDRVRAAGGRVAWALASVTWMRDLAGRDGEASIVGARAATEEGFGEVYRSGAALTVLHLVAVDEAGHAHGAASAAYARAADDAVRTTRVLRERIAPDAVWFVGADHGHMPAGGHGGPEPAVRAVAWYGLWPASARLGASIDHLASESAARLAPTLAAELGVAAPDEALDAALPLPDGAVVSQPALAAREAAVAGAFVRVAADARRARLVRGALFVVVLIGAFAAGARRGRARELIAALLVTLSACVGFALAGPGSTLSAIRTQNGFIAHALVAMTAFALAVWPMARRLGARRATTEFAACIPIAFACITTAFSLGRASVTPVESLVLPATGLLPCAVLAALALAYIVSRLRPARARRDDAGSSLHDPTSSR